MTGLLSISYQSLGVALKNLVHVPSHRNDLVTINDLAEEVARVRGYDCIKKESFIIPYQNFSKNIIEENIKQDTFTKWVL